ncbi:MAG: phage tail tip lysozyme [Clostridia bacterium]|nr:phage tail tip lysozyme [Clostridia bacterium]
MTRKYVCTALVCALLLGAIVIPPIFADSSNSNARNEETEFSEVIEAEEIVSEKELAARELPAPEPAETVVKMIERRLWVVPEPVTELIEVLPQDYEQIKEENERLLEEIKLLNAKNESLVADNQKLKSEYERLKKEYLQITAEAEAAADTKNAEFIPSEEHLVKCAEEFPVATQVWCYLSETMGLNDYVCAGIIGNMMTECGGHTLDLHWYSGSVEYGYYGLCQWSLKYRPWLTDASLEDQLIHLNESLEIAFTTYGKRYKEGFTYADFCALSSASDAAVAFAAAYERCTSTSYERRGQQAEFAYSYFVPSSTN